MKPYVISKKVATTVRNFLREKNVQQLSLRKKYETLVPGYFYIMSSDDMII